jgi:hypothetical protein
VVAMRVEDILNITTNLGPIFGYIRVYTCFFDTEKPYEVHYFWRNDALKIKQLVSGHIIAVQKKLDLAPLTKEQTCHLLTELGKSNL